jgi:hypothetical protein
MHLATVTDLEHYILSRLNQLGYLAERLHELISGDAESYRKRKNEITADPHYSQNLPEEAHLPLRKLKEYVRAEPEKGKIIVKQIELSFELSRVDLDLKLSEEIFPSLTFSSLALLGYAMFDEGLIRMCNILADTKGYTVRLSDLAGQNTIEKTRNYLSKVASVHYDFEHSSSWLRVRSHQDVRNLLAHNGGVLDDSQRAQKVRQFMSSQKTALTERDNRLVLNERYVEEMINDLQDWMIPVFEML